jgi:hypothetical protein
MAKKPIKRAAEPEEPESYPYNVETLAKALDLAPASVRVKLRNAGIEKAGKMYGWETKREYEKVLDELENDEPAPAPAKSTKKKAAPEPEPKKATLRRRKRAPAEEEATA